MSTELSLLTLLLIANGSPVVTRALLGHRCRWPLDGGLLFVDGHRILGKSKTLVGVMTALSTSALAAPLLGQSWQIGILIGAASMLGDAFSSFIKRRLHMAPGTRALGLDQIPESLLAMLACKVPLGLSWLQVLMLALAFMLADLIISRTFYHLGIRHHPH